MAIGDLLSTIGFDRMPLAAPRRLAPRDAAALTLKVYLERALWLIPSDVQDRLFRLRKVLLEWPNEDEDLDQPCASIIAISDERQAHNFVPTMLEDTWNRYGDSTVLWKTSEHEFVFQVDFWLTNKPERQAIEAGLDEYFCPGEERRGVMLEGPLDYWSWPVRFRLETLRGSNREDSSDLVLGRNRLLVARLVAHIDDLQLRQARELDPRINLSVDDAASEQIFPRPAGD